MSVDNQLLLEGKTQLDSLIGQLDSMRETVVSARSNIKAATQNVDPFPQRYVGVIDNYRFTTGAKGQTPTHRFEVICGNGLYLHVEATPDQFASMMVNMTMGEITPSKVKDKLVIVERNKEAGMVPVEMINEDILPCQDKWGNFLWVGANIVTQDLGLSGVVLNKEPYSASDADERFIVYVDFTQDGTAAGETTRYSNEIVVQV